jgi:hypothetical protein
MKDIFKSPQELLNDLVQAGVVKPGNIYGCTEAEIIELERLFKMSLPESYKQFLRVMGKEKKDSYFYADYLMFDLNSLKMAELSRKEAAEHLEDLNYTLKPTDFVCLYSDATFQGWFDTAAGADPPLNLATEMDEDEPQFNAYPSFLAYLNYIVDVYVGREED